ncbi:unnamed protein product [Linum tenue]|uniref:Armadillo-like repeats domain-containing protein n=1 Tax=Linum tenue TaxID=586396 RepID=A0AAV0K2C8_9ROSI|nr:unnamed protein product [Linum tenue]
MASIPTVASSACSSSSSAAFPASSRLGKPKSCCPLPSAVSFPASPFLPRPRRRIALAVAAAGSKSSIQKDNKKADEEENVIEVEEDLPWIQEKALDLVEFTGSVTQAIPGPRVGHSKLPWILALPLAYAGVTFVIAFVKTVRKLSSPKTKRRRLVNKNATLCRSIDELLQSGGDELQPSALEGLMKKTGFTMEDILRKYIRYALNEKPFNPELVADLIRLRVASQLSDPQMASILNEISRLIVRDKGPVVMDVSGYTEKGFKRKLAVQALFGKVFYLSELPELCSRDSSLVVKEIFGVTDEDADQLRVHTFSEAGEMDSLERMVGGGSDSDGSPDEESKSA